MKVNGRDLDIGEESISVEQDGTNSTVRHMEAIRQELVVHVFDCFLLSDYVPLLRNLFFDSSFFSKPRSWVPILNTEFFLFGQSVGHVVGEVVALTRCRVSLFRVLAWLGRGKHEGDGNLGK